MWSQLPLPNLCGFLYFNVSFPVSPSSWIPPLCSISLFLQNIKKTKKKSFFFTIISDAHSQAKLECEGFFFSSFFFFMGCFCDGRFCQHYLLQNSTGSQWVSVFQISEVCSVFEPPIGSQNVNKAKIFSAHKSLGS